MRFAVTIHHSRFDSIICRALLAFTLAMTVPCAQPQSIVDSGTATLSGTVVDAAGAVIPKAILSLEKTHSPHLQTTTDSSGHFAIEAPPGEYILNVSAYGFQASKTPLHLTAETPDVERISLLISSTDYCTLCGNTVETIQIEVPKEPLNLLLPLNPIPPFKFTARNTKHPRS
jgi:hypothetical protein